MRCRFHFNHTVTSRLNVTGAWTEIVSRVRVDATGTAVIGRADTLSIVSRFRRFGRELKLSTNQTRFGMAIVGTGCGSYPCFLKVTSWMKWCKPCFVQLIPWKWSASAISHWPPPRKGIELRHQEWSSLWCRIRRTWKHKDGYFPTVFIATSQFESLKFHKSHMLSIKQTNELRCRIDKLFLTTI
jgi:hypothetical protein